MDPEDGSLDGGPLNAAIANEIGHLLADFTGRGPLPRARSSTTMSSSACWSTA